MEEVVLGPPDRWLCAMEARSAAQRSALPGVDAAAPWLRWARDSCMLHQGGESVPSMTWICGKASLAVD